MKLLIVAPYFYPKKGGMENYAWHIVGRLKKNFGWDVSVITTNHVENVYKKESIAGSTIYRLPYVYKASNTPISPFWFDNIQDIVKKEKPVIVNGHTPVPFISDIAARVAHAERIPFVLTYQNDLVKEHVFLRFIVSMYYQMMGNKTGKLSSAIIATSDYYAKKSFFLKKFAKKVTIVPPGVDLQRYNDLSITPQLAKKYQGKNIVLFVGQLDKTHLHKGLPVLIESMSQVQKTHPNTLLLVVGNGDMVETYKKQANELDVAMDIQERVEDNDLVRFYKLSDIVVLPSTTDSEGFGMVLIEAGACKKPVIGTKAGGIPSIITHKKNGLLVDPHNAAELAKKILYVLENEQVRSSMGKAGYNAVKERYLWDKQAEKTHRLISSLV